MSIADYIYLRTTNSILKDGSWDTNEEVRPRWPDGTPAHTIKKFGVNNVYKLSDEFPIVTLRSINWQAAIDETIWIWVKKSNNVNDLNSSIWNQWADENGSIGEAYGAQVRKKAKYKEGEFDQIDRVIFNLKNQPSFRSMITELFVHEDLHRMGLYPCVHGMNFDVTDGKLNLFLNQRSNDTLAAGSWNVVQYAALVHMLAKVCDLKVGELSHMIVNSHIYDRHVPFVVDLTFSRAKEIQKRLKEVDFEWINKFFSDAKVKEKFESFRDEILKDSISFDKEIAEAKSLETTANVNYQEYTKKVVGSRQFEASQKIIESMLENPSFDKALKFKSPKLELKSNVNDYYSFVSPKMRDKDGKVVDNPDSSFNVKDYCPKEEGIKLQTRVPVAE